MDRCLAFTRTMPSSDAARARSAALDLLLARARRASSTEALEWLHTAQHLFSAAELDATASRGGTGNASQTDASLLARGST